MVSAGVLLLRIRGDVQVVTLAATRVLDGLTQTGEIYDLRTLRFMFLSSYLYTFSIRYDGDARRGSSCSNAYGLNSLEAMTPKF